MNDAAHNEGIRKVRVDKVTNAGVEQRDDALAVEEPLEIRLAHWKDGELRELSLSITMRTPGHDEELAAGFLLGEGIVTGAADIVKIEALPASGGKPSNTVRVEVVRELLVDPERLLRHFYATSSCGICGKASLEALATQGCPVLPKGRPKLARAAVHGLVEQLRGTQSVFEQTGGLHAAALFDSEGKLLALREDVGRHNALDKLVGARMLQSDVKLRPPLNDCAVLVSGRASFELVQKALMAGVPVLAAVGAPSSLAVETAREFGMTLLGFVRDGRFNVYAGGERIE
ncbi:MAG: formate dehydrogenase accessory sulfurtransferase FdhD [Planctomycetes bacterium]|nr:formate dehydrogenase accessory sulfurtransferase FdhD [Planctomycetota bacterium]